MLSSFHSKTIAAVGAPRFEPEAHISSIPCFQKTETLAKELTTKRTNETPSLNTVRKNEHHPPAIRPDSANGRQSYKIKTQKKREPLFTREPEKPKNKF